VLDAADLQVVAHRSAQSGQILPVGFSDDGKSLVAVEFGNKISQWNVDTWHLRSRVPSGLHIERYIKRRFAIPPDSDILLCPSDENIVWWDLAQSKEQARILVNTRRKGGIAVSPTEPLLAVVCASDFIFLWDWQTRQFVDRLRGPRVFNSVAFSPDGRRLVSGSNGKGALMLWDVSARQEIARFGPHLSPILRSVQFSPDGNMICAVDNEGTAHFLRAPSFEMIKALEAERRKKEIEN
jgi:WD40 repeat protein